MVEEFVKPVSMEAACMGASDTHHDVDYDHCIRFLFVVLSSAKAADGGIHGLARLAIDDAAGTEFRLDDLAQLEEEDEAAGKRVRSQMATQVASHAQKHFLRSTPGRRSASPASSTPSPSPDTMTSNGWCDWTRWLLELSPSGAWKHKGIITKGVILHLFACTLLSQQILCLGSEQQSIQTFDFWMQPRRGTPHGWR